MDLKKYFGEEFMKCFEGIDFETFLTLQHRHIVEAIPQLVRRIKFENLYQTFLKEVAEKENNDASIINEAELDEATLRVSLSPIMEFQHLAEVSTQTEDPIYDLNTAEDILAIKSLELKIVIAKCSIQGLPMDVIDRVVVGKEIISHLLASDVNRKIGKDEFEKLACLITQVFKDEDKGSYYTAPCDSHPAQGKLYSAYSNYRTQLRATELIRKQKIGRPKKVPRTVADNETEQISDDEGTSNPSNDLENCDFEEIVEYWKLTFAQRQKQILELSIPKYLQKYPMLGLPNGYKLFALDAITIHGSIVSNLPEISHKIFIYAERLKSPSLAIKSLLAEFERTADIIDKPSVTEFRQLTALKLLPHIMPNPLRNKSKAEVAQQFIPYYKTAVEEENLKEGGVTSGRIALSFIGDLLHPAAFLSIADKLYMIENAIYGFEVLFKTYLSFGQSFPADSAHVWKFVSEMVFNIRTKGRKIATIQTFINDIDKLPL